MQLTERLKRQAREVESAVGEDNPVGGWKCPLI
jgi:hypothetical protein